MYVTSSFQANIACLLRPSVALASPSDAARRLPSVPAAVFPHHPSPGQLELEALREADACVRDS
jgi:hypothetical protein